MTGPGGRANEVSWLAERVVGEPVERDGAVVVPLLAVRAGGGGGAGGGEDPASGASGSGSGSGWGGQARPVGAYVLEQGTVRFEPAVDVTRIAIVGQVVALVALLVLLRRRRRRG